jgi:hypothetical protein
MTLKDDLKNITPEVKAAWATMAKDPSQRDAMAEIITEYVQPNHITNTYMSLLLNTRALNAGDILVKKLRKGIRVHTLIPGAVHLGSEITLTERMNYILDGSDVKVGFSEWDLERGDIGTLAEIQTEMRAKLADYYFNKVFTALSTIWTNGNTPSNYVNLGTALTKTALKDGVDQVNLTGGGAKIIVGTRKALNSITEFGGFWDSGVTAAGTPRVAIPSVIEEIHNTGWVGRFYGVPVMALDQIYDNPEDYNGLLPEDKVLVIGQKVGEFITYGDVKTKTWTDNNPTPPYYYVEMYQQFGMIIDNAQGIYVIKVA